MLFSSESGDALCGFGKVPGSPVALGDDVDSAPARKGNPKSRCQMDNLDRLTWGEVGVKRWGLFPIDR